MLKTHLLVIAAQVKMQLSYNWTDTEHHLGQTNLCGAVCEEQPVRVRLVVWFVESPWMRQVGLLSPSQGGYI